jgi:hypothetical protein
MGERSPLLVRRGGCGIKKIFGAAHLSAADGVVAYESHSRLSDHPVRSNKEASRHFLDVAQKNLLEKTSNDTFVIQRYGIKLPSLHP